MLLDNLVSKSCRESGRVVESRSRSARPLQIVFPRKWLCKPPKLNQNQWNSRSLNLALGYKKSPRPVIVFGGPGVGHFKLASWLIYSLASRFRYYICVWRRSRALQCIPLQPSWAVQLLASLHARLSSIPLKVYP